MLSFNNIGGLYIYPIFLSQRTIILKLLIPTTQKKGESRLPKTPRFQTLIIHFSEKSSTNYMTDE